MSEDNKLQKTEVFDFSITPEEEKKLDAFFRTKILPIAQKVNSPLVQRINILSPMRIKINEIIRMKFIRFAKETNSVLKITQDPIGFNCIYRCESPYIELDKNIVRMLSELQKIVDIMEMSADGKELFVIEATYRIAETRILPIDF